MIYKHIKYCSMKDINRYESFNKEKNYTPQYA